MVSDRESLVLLEDIRRDVQAAVRRQGNRPLAGPVVSELLTEVGDSAVQTFLVSLDAVPSRVLGQIAEVATDPEVLRVLATHPRAPLSVLQQQTASPDPAVRRAVAGNRALTPRLAASLVTDPDCWVRLALSENPAIPVRLQETLATDPAPFVRAGLTRLKPIDPGVLRHLIDDPDPFVRARVAAVAAVPEQSLLEWADSDDSFAQLCLLQRKELPDAVVESLCFSAHVAVQRQAIPRRQLSPDEMVGWAEHGDRVVRSLVAARPNLPAEVQQLLARDPEPSVRQALAANPKLDPEAALRLLADSAEVVAPGLAANPAAPEPVVTALCQLADPEVRKCLAHRPGLTPEQTQTLLSSDDDELIYHLAQREEGIPELDGERAQRLSRHALPSVRALAATSRYLPEPAMLRLSRDPAAGVRRRLAANPAVTPRLLHELSGDPDRETAGAATRRLRELERVAAQPQSRGDEPKLLRRIISRILTGEEH